MPNITPREREVLERVVSERTNKAIAEARLLALLVGKDPAVVIDRRGRVHAARGKPASLGFRLASGPRRGTWWHATGEKIELKGVGGWTVVLFRRVRGPAAG